MSDSRTDADLLLDRVKYTSIGVANREQQGHCSGVKPYL